jgi:hypothetical protein
LHVRVFHETRPAIAHWLCDSTPWISLFMSVTEQTRSR